MHYSGHIRPLQCCSIRCSYYGILLRIQQFYFIANTLLSAPFRHPNFIYCPQEQNSFILKTGMETFYSFPGQLDSIWLLHWREWERIGANVRGGGEGGRTASAQIGSQAHQQQRQSIFLIPISRVFSCQSSVRLWLRFHCRLKCPEASANHHLPLHTFLRSSVILSSAARDCPSGPSLIYPSFLNI